LSAIAAIPQKNVEKGRRASSPRKDISPTKSEGLLDAN